MSESRPDELVLSVEPLSMIQTRFDMPDPTGTGAGDDGENADNLNHPIY